MSQMNPVHTFTNYFSRHTRKILAEWILGKQVGKEWTGFIWLRIQTRDNKPSVSISWRIH
jgi:hypothetical protein